MIIAVPSFSLLYAMEELIEPTINVKVSGVFKGGIGLILMENVQTK